MTKYPKEDSPDAGEESQREKKNLPFANVLAAEEEIPVAAVWGTHEEVLEEYSNSEPAYNFPLQYRGVECWRASGSLSIATSSGC